MDKETAEKIIDAINRYHQIYNPQYDCWSIDIPHMIRTMLEQERLSHDNRAVNAAAPCEGARHGVTTEKQ